MFLAILHVKMLKIAQNIKNDNITITAEGNSTIFVSE